MPTNSWITDNVPLDKPSPARMYDYFLGGHHNFAVDRIAAEQVIANYPDTMASARANRAFLRRAVTFLAAHGIDQFLDIGSGIPTVGNVHEVAQKMNPAAHVVYVDNDGIAVRHSESILQNTPNAAVIQADGRQPDRILNHPSVMRLLDFSRPIAVMLVALLHFVPDDEEAYRIIRVLRDTLAPGSYVVISHGTYEGLPSEVVQQAEKLYSRSTHQVKFRVRSHIESFFQGLELVEPGLVYVPQWRPEGPNDLFLDRAEQCGIFAGIARKS